MGRNARVESKWISGLSPGMPVAVGAWRVLELRLRAVHHYLPLATQEPHRDVEHVHQLRVATRRCRAALDLFGECLPGKERRRVRRTLRRIRRAAGEARDADVLLLDLEGVLKMASSQQLAGLHWLAGQLAASRARAQAELDASCALEDLQQVIGETLAVVRPPGNDAEPPQTLAELSKARIIPLLDQLEQLGQGDLNSETHLHRIRIDGKHLRYTLEVLADCVPPPFRKELYPLVEQMQDILGLINDSYVALARITQMRETARRFWPVLYRQWRSGIQVSLRHHRGRLTRERRRFASFWKRWQAMKVRERFAVLLGEALAKTVQENEEPATSTPATPGDAETVEVQPPVGLG